VSDDRNEGCIFTVMSCVYVIGNKKTKSRSFKVLSVPVGKQMALPWKSWLLPYSGYNLCFYLVTFDGDDVGMVCCDEIIGWII
jgi:hypothetical protein